MNLPLLYFVWTEEYCQTSPNKNKSPNLWHVTSILVCCIFGNIVNFFQDTLLGNFILQKSCYQNSVFESQLTIEKRLNFCNDVFNCQKEGPTANVGNAVLPTMTSFRKTCPKKSLLIESCQKMCTINTFWFRVDFELL